jgi:thiol-disulfide isomerase/thioredoxin
MKPYSLLVNLACFLFFTTSHAQPKPLAADEILHEAMQVAAREHKNVLIIFHASWCGWCHKMDSSLSDKTCKKFFDDNYVIRHLVVFESNEKKDLENPGAIEILTKYHGNDEGIPFWLVFDKDGNLLADSKIRAEGSGSDSKGQNVGCPAAENEVVYFMEVLRKTSHITKEQEAAIEKRFRQNED